MTLKFWEHKCPSILPLQIVVAAVATVRTNLMKYNLIYLMLLNIST